MPEYVTDEHVEQLEQLAERMRQENPRQMTSIKVAVYHTELPSQRELEDHDDAPTLHHQSEIVEFERMPSLMELLDFMGHRSLRDQVYMIANLLTVSGFTQAEISSVLGISHKTYRNALLDIRRDFRVRRDNEEE